MSNVDFRTEWFYQFASIAKRLEPSLSTDEIRNLGVRYIKELEDPGVHIYNNMYRHGVDRDLLEYTNVLLQPDSKYLINPFGTVFFKHDEKTDPSMKLVAHLLKERKKYKTIMFQHPKGTPLHELNKMIQMVIKVITNSFFGTMGEKNSTLYNDYIFNSITYAGVLSIVTALNLFESLSNNFRFETVSDLITYADKILNEKNKYDIRDYIDKEVTYEEVYNNLAKGLKNDHAVETLAVYLKNAQKLDENAFNKLYYKNNLFAFIEQSRVKEVLSKTAEKIKDGNIFMDVEDTSTHPEIVEFNDLVEDMVYYHGLYLNSFVRAKKDEREIVIIVDTDSNFLNLNPHFLFMKENFGLTDDTLEEQISTINVFIHVYSELMVKTLDLLAINSGIDPKHSKLNMKNEFIYSVILNTMARKSYCGIMIAQEGRLIQDDGVDPETEYVGSFDLKGITFKKSGTPEALSNLFEKLTINILYNGLSHYEVLSKLDDIRSDIRTNIGKYLLPSSYKKPESYENPWSVSVCTSGMLWNRLEDGMTLQQGKVRIVKLKAKVDFAALYDILAFENPNATEVDGEEVEPIDIEQYIFSNLRSSFGFDDGEINIIIKNKAKYKTLSDVYTKGDELSTRMKSIAIPVGEDVPEYIIPLIDYRLMITTAMKSFNPVLKPLGITLVDEGYTSMIDVASLL